MLMLVVPCIPTPVRCERREEQTSNTLGFAGQTKDGDKVEVKTRVDKMNPKTNERNRTLCPVTYFNEKVK